MIKVYAPISIGNINVGFDILGVALSPINGTLLGDCVVVEESKQFSLVNTGVFLNNLPKKIENNIIYQCWKRFCNVIQRTCYMAITLEKNVPVGSGLGSSACSIVASLMAMNIYCDYPLNNNQLLVLMGEMEGYISGGIHFDNVAPCFLGGMQLIIQESDIISQSLPIFKDWLWVLAYPGTNISTSESRSVLPLHYTREDCITHSRYIAGFIHACYTNQSMLAASLMKDVIAEPYRINLLPNFKYVYQYIISIGALVCGISGAGPALFAIFDNNNIAISAANWLTKYYLKNDQGFVYICKLNDQGAYIITG